MARYLVTGIAGFIGSSLAHALVARGEYVRGIDNFATGREENLAEIGSRVDLVRADLVDRDAAQEACRGIDFVLHQAAIPSVPKSVDDPWGSNRANVDATVSLLIAARDAKVRRVVYAASSSAYGNQPALPKHEDMLPKPISPYAVAKLASEFYMAAFFSCYGLETVALRYFNVFGPRQDPSSPYSGVLSRFITLMLEGKQPVIYGDGEQSRDFCYVENVVQANLKGCVAPAAACAGQVFNVACSQRVTLNQTYKLLQHITGYQGPPRYEAERAGDVKHSLADIGAARTVLGYEPLVDFEEGLKRTVAWYAGKSTAGC
jgi:UDP-glucose 4-epimerase